MVGIANRGPSSRYQSSCIVCVVDRVSSCVLPIGLHRAISLCVAVLRAQSRVAGCVCCSPPTFIVSIVFGTVADCSTDYYAAIPLTSCIIVAVCVEHLRFCCGRNMCVYLCLDFGETPCRALIYRLGNTHQSQTGPKRSRNISKYQDYLCANSHLSERSHQPLSQQLCSPHTCTTYVLWPWRLALNVRELRRQPQKPYIEGIFPSCIKRGTLQVIYRLRGKLYIVRSAGRHAELCLISGLIYSPRLRCPCACRVPRTSTFCCCLAPLPAKPPCFRCRNLYSIIVRYQLFSEFPSRAVLAQGAQILAVRHKRFPESNISCEQQTSLPPFLETTAVEDVTTLG